MNLLAGSPPRLTAFLPEQYKGMKRLATDSNSVKKSELQIFYEQANMMEEFTDDFSCNDEFRCFFPTYSSMNDKQLRAYFFWRTGVRRGVAEETSISYVDVYLYELLMLIGTKGPEYAFKKIYNFYKAYRTIDVRLDAYVPLWIKDMVIFYNLDGKLLDGIYDDSRFSDFTYNLTPIHTYHCQNGIWSCERYYGNLMNNKEIGNILKYIDFLLRKKTNYSHALNGDGINCSNK